MAAPTMKVLDFEKRKEIVTEALVNIKSKVTSAMKAKAMLELGVSWSTVNQYLKGIVTSLPLAESLLELFLAEIKNSEGNSLAI